MIDGFGVFDASSTSPNRTAIGYAQGSSLSPATTYQGQPIDANSLIAVYTYAGDANLDKTVNLSDFTQMATHFNQTSSTWFTGDFNYSGTVDSADFTLLDRVVLRPLPYPDADRLLMTWETNDARNLAHERLSPVNFVDYRGLSQVFDDAAAWWYPQLNLTEPGRDPMRVNAVEASANFFSVIAVAGFPRGSTGFCAARREKNHNPNADSRTVAISAALRSCLDL